ncbi:hypothetical protein CBR_g54844 [Chara braunii]|uniref:CCHC-type domain-containing protein n=1 Tax=Chara braunii TaxID=69332 RepID=A0A388JPN6_CHABU|nr:hypothetical protein CBR_g54844 [Chara braunii]|eukprot:GBG59741.1 hypothetical protein CBR_g54844 [Chara braunii]
MSEWDTTSEDDRILRSTRRPIAHLAFGPEGDRLLFRQLRERQQQQWRARAAEASRAFASEAAASAAMATAVQQSSQASSSGTVGSMIAQTSSQSIGVMASQPIMLTPEQVAVQQALQEAQLKKALGEIKAEKERMTRRRVGLERRQEDVSELEGMDLTCMDDDVRTLRAVLLDVVEMQDHQTSLLQDIQQSLAVLVGRAQAAPSPSGPGAWLVVHPPPFVPPVTGVSPYVSLASVQAASLGMSQTGGDKRVEDLDTWLRSVPVYVKCKLTLPLEEMLVAASYLEGSAARWLSGLVQLQGYDHDFHAWAVNQKLNDFLKLVEDRWHDPQEAQKATDAILTLNNRQFKSVREATDAVERLICVPGVRYDPQVLLTSYLRCFPLPLRNQLAGEANINMHNFPSFSKKALDLEAKIGHGHTPTMNRRKKSLPPNWKAKGRIMFVDNDGSTIELKDDFEAGVGSKADRGWSSRCFNTKGKATVDAVEAPDLGVKLTLTPPWEKVGLSEDVWRDRYTRQACIRCGQYGHNQFKCRNTKTLKWMRTHPVLSDALKRWIEVIEQYNFEPQYLKGEYNKATDAPSRRPDFSGALITEFGIADDFTRSLVEAYREDPFMAEIIRRLKTKVKTTPAEFELVNDLLFLEKAGNKRLCVPNRESLRSLFLGECHDATGHFGCKKTAANLLQQFWWPTMMRDAKLYVETCQVCEREKPRTQAPFGLLKPLPIPERPGESLPMDFMDTLVTDKSGMRHIFVIVDRFSKYARLVAMPETAKTEYVIRLFKENWVRDFGLPTGSQMRSPEWDYSNCRKMEQPLSPVIGKGCSQKETIQDDPLDDLTGVDLVPKTATTLTKEMYQRYLSAASTDFDPWFGTGLLPGTVETSEANKSYAWLCQDLSTKLMSFHAESSGYYQPVSLTEGLGDLSSIMPNNRDGIHCQYGNLGSIFPEGNMLGGTEYDPLFSLWGGRDSESSLCTAQC